MSNMVAEMVEGVAGKDVKGRAAAGAEEVVLCQESQVSVIVALSLARAGRAG